MLDDIIFKQIGLDDPLYQQERVLRNRILLRPLGIPDFGWEMFDHRSVHFVAVWNDEVVACVLLNLYETGADSGRLMQMAVTENLQGQGIGRRLVLTLLEYARQRRLSMVTCHAREAVVNFYARLGFEVYGAPFDEVGVVHWNMRVQPLEAETLSK